MAYANKGGDMRARFSEKIKSTETYTNWCNVALWIFFFGKHARWRSRVLDFPQDSRIRVNLKINSWRTCVKANLFLHWRIFKNVFKIRSERIHDSHSISIMKNFFRFRLLVQILDSGPSGPSLLDRPWWTVPRIKAKVNFKKLVLSFRNWALMTQPKSTR